ncbi:MAG: YlmC/YmxH family sporulation protein [Clostridia bacterium]|nr:YlmC/YmxH family sporulation protein [Clostridia bacterium]
MNCRIDELRNKQVVCMHTGNVLGFVGDIEFDSESGKLTAIVIFGKPRVLGLFGKYEDTVIPWDDIEVIGEETVLIKNQSNFCKPM